jgi:hypothetical protein
MEKEIGSPFEVYRNAINRYEMFLDSGLKPEHIIKLGQILGLNGKEYDVIWIAYLACTFLVKYSKVTES